ncbi:Succinate dehydrogenase subunit 7, mitochondrial, partial [Ananas comosus]
DFQPTPKTRIALFRPRDRFHFLESSSSSSMASDLFSSLRRPRSQVAPPPPSLPHFPRRGYHVELGAREKALLEEDPALKKFKSYKSSVKQVSKIGNALTMLVIAACTYEIFAVATTKN